MSFGDFRGGSKRKARHWTRKQSSPAGSPAECQRFTTTHRYRGSADRLYERANTGVKDKNARGNDADNEDSDMTLTPERGSAQTQTHPEARQPPPRGNRRTQPPGTLALSIIVRTVRGRSRSWTHAGSCGGAARIFACGHV